MSGDTRLIVLFALATPVSFSGCSPGLYLAEQKAETMFVEIESLAADRSSTSDNECGVIGLACGAPVGYLVYSRATVNEDELIKKVEEYNEILRFIERRYGPFFVECFEVQTMPGGAISENGMCVAGSR
jgi:hypothetical protein